MDIQRTVFEPFFCFLHYIVFTDQSLLARDPPKIILNPTGGLVMSAKEYTGADDVLTKMQPIKMTFARTRKSYTKPLWMRASRCIRAFGTVCRVSLALQTTSSAKR